MSTLYGKPVECEECNVKPQVIVFIHQTCSNISISFWHLSTKLFHYHCDFLLLAGWYRPGSFGPHVRWRQSGPGSLQWVHQDHDPRHNACCRLCQEIAHVLRGRSSGWCQSTLSQHNCGFQSLISCSTWYFKNIYSSTVPHSINAYIFGMACLVCTPFLSWHCSAPYVNHTTSSAPQNFI